MKCPSLQIKIELINDSFREGEGKEISRILDEISCEMKDLSLKDLNNEYYRKIKDSNGNTVGAVAIITQRFF